MNALTLYTYAHCDTCKKAKKYLKAKGLSYTEIPIRDRPPTPSELKAVYTSMKGQLSRLWNTSGEDYRSLGMKDKVAHMTLEEAFTLLSTQGNLVKRPFLVVGAKGLTGFKEEEWDNFFLKLRD